MHFTDIFLIMKWTSRGRNPEPGFQENSVNEDLRREDASPAPAQYWTRRFEARFQQGEASGEKVLADPNLCCYMLSGIIVLDGF